MVKCKYTIEKYENYTFPYINCTLFHFVSFSFCKEHSSPQQRNTVTWCVAKKQKMQ